MIINISVDKERARSMLKMVESRETFFKSLKETEVPPTILAENYYESIKELCLALGFAEGYKFIGENAHKECITFVRRYTPCTEEVLDLMQDLRIRRNKSMYEGKPIEEIYLKNRKEELLNIMKTLKELLRGVLKQ